MTVLITEILGRSEQGAAQPYICRADDGNTYFVKGIAAGRRSQVCEWIAGNLALYIGLPIAPFKLVEIPKELIRDNLSYTDLGSGLAFGSCKQMIMELNFEGVNEISDELQQSVLVFDWWIQNDDRNLTQSGGNPNLFWDPKNKKLVVIDHNLAFDPDFSPSEFRKLHIFNRQFETLFHNPDLLQTHEVIFEKALTHWDKICAALPEEWRFCDSDMTTPANFDLNAMFQTLELYKTDSFWVLP